MNILFSFQRLQNSISGLFSSSHFFQPLFPTFPSICFLCQPFLAIAVKLLLNLVYSVDQIFPAKLAFPYYNDPPSFCLKVSVVAEVPLAVGGHLRTPELDVCLGLNILDATIVAVPEATVHKDAGVVLGKDDIRLAGERLYVDTVSVTQSEKLLAQLHLRLGVPGPDASHALVALLGSEDVRHDYAITISGTICISLL